MPKSQSQPATADKGARPLEGVESAGSIDKIRDILFGQQVRDYEHRFAQLEKMLRKETDGIREELTRRLDTLESYVKKEMESHLERLKNEKADRAEAVKEVAQELSGAAKSFEKKTSQLDEQLTKTERALREQLLEQSKSLQDELRNKHAAGAAALDQAVADLRNRKTDRTALSAMFAELAMRISGEEGEAGA